MCFALPPSTIYLITVDNWCAAFAINYGSAESLKNSLAAHYVVSFSSSWFLDSMLEQTIALFSNYKSNLNDIVVYFMEIV